MKQFVLDRDFGAFGYRLNAQFFRDVVFVRFPDHWTYAQLSGNLLDRFAIGIKLKTSRLRMLNLSTAPMASAFFQILHMPQQHL